MNRIAAPLAALSLAGCTPQRVATGREYLDAVAQVCQQAVIAIPRFPWIESWVAKGKTATGIADMALDPTILAWLTGILGRL